MMHRRFASPCHALLFSLLYAVVVFLLPSTVSRAARYSWRGREAAKCLGTVTPLAGGHRVGAARGASAGGCHGGAECVGARRSSRRRPRAGACWTSRRRPCTRACRSSRRQPRADNSVQELPREGLRPRAPPARERWRTGFELGGLPPRRGLRCAAVARARRGGELQLHWLSAEHGRRRPPPFRTRRRRAFPSFPPLFPCSRSSGIAARAAAERGAGATSCGAVQRRRGACGG
jgi:hypothetical protein